MWIAERFHWAQIVAREGASWDANENLPTSRPLVTLGAPVLPFKLALIDRSLAAELLQTGELQLEQNETKLVGVDVT